MSEIGPKEWSRVISLEICGLVQMFLTPSHNYPFKNFVISSVIVALAWYNHDHESANSN